MNMSALGRRLFYIMAMVVLLIPLYILGAPSVRNRTDGSVTNEGGTLAKLRAKYDLGQGDLGEIDPASESMRLATLGMRGVAATILWQNAERYKKIKAWDNLAATLNQIVILQPHFIEIWKYQSHNLSYNISVEFDDYRQRYQWVKRGIDYLTDGSKQNRRKTEFPYELGWYFGNKMGISDEKKQFRELYRNDELFHADISEKSMDVLQQEGLGPDKKPDNWLTGRLYYEKSYAMVSGKENAKPAKSPLMFYRMSSTWLTKYAEAIQTEGYLGEPALVAWRRAGDAITVFGNMPIQTSFGDEITLNSIKKAHQDLDKARDDFEEFCGDTYKEIMKLRRDQLTPEELAAYEKPELERTFDDMVLCEYATAKFQIAPNEIAAALSSDKREDGFRKAERVKAAQDYINHIEIYRNQINFPYWQARATAEQEPAALSARKNMFDANNLLDDGRLDEAIEKYNIAWNSWDELFNKYPAMMIDDVADDIAEAVRLYRKHLDTNELPEDFPLKNFLKFRELQAEEKLDQVLMQMMAEWPDRYPDRNFLEEMLTKVEKSQPPEVKDSTEEPTELKVVVPGNQAAPNSVLPDAVKPEAGLPPMPAPSNTAPPAPEAKPEPEVKPEPAPEPDKVDTSEVPAATKPEDGNPPKP